MATPRLFNQAARPSGRAFGEAGSLRPDTMTGFDRRDAVTGMQNEQNRESSLYNRIFRQQSRASRKGDIEAGKGALQTMAAAREAGFSVGGIKSFERNRSNAAGTLQNIEEQTAMMEGQEDPGGVWQDDGQGGSNFVAREAAPVSGAMGIPEVPGMQQAPAASLADSFQDKMVSIAGNRGTINGVPTEQALGETPSPTPSLAEKFSQDFPNTSKLLGLMEKMEPLSEPGYDPSADPELARFKENEALYGREGAFDVASAGDKAKLRLKNKLDAESREGKRKKSLVDLAEFRRLSSQYPGFTD